MFEEVSTRTVAHPSWDRLGRPLCPHCGVVYDPEDYRDDVQMTLCSACKGEIEIAKI